MSILNKKTMTKLLDPSFRKKILELMSEDEKIRMRIYDYAHYVVDSQILQRMPGYEKERESGWGFPQLNLICAVKKEIDEKRVRDNSKSSYADGTIMFKTIKEQKNIIEKKFFEFKTVNHFLKDKDGDSAVEVVECILVLWAKEDKEIVNFDYKIIDDYLVNLDKQMKNAENNERNDSLSCSNNRISTNNE